MQSIQDKQFENIVFSHDDKTGLVSIIAVHNTKLGPALGGCRIRPYRNVEDALEEVLKLSEAMTYKNSLCGINFGGGKSVIINDPQVKTGRVELFKTFAKTVESLGGRYITAEDMGTSVTDMEVIKSVTTHVSGSDPKNGGGGDPSPYTAKGVFLGIKACLESVYGSDDFSSKHVLVQGVGNVGYHVVKHLVAANAKVTVSDTIEANVLRVKNEFSVRSCAAEKLMSLPADVFCPCAIGGIVNEQSIKHLNIKIIAGGANNQLLSESLSQRLVDKGILYAPDFAINAGGVILCAEEFEPGGFTESRVMARVDKIYDTIKNIIEIAKSTNTFTGYVAKDLAMKRIAEVSQASKQNSGKQQRAR
jgi:leucine dehydrogenase